MGLRGSSWIIGYLSTTRDGTTHVSADASPAMTVLSLAAIVLFGLLMQIKVSVSDFQVASLRRRFSAFLFDLWFVLFALIGVSSFVHIFRWHFERDYRVPGDAVGVALVFLNLGLIISYFVLPLARRRQTIGTWIFRLATITPAGDALYLPISTAAWRVLMEFNGLIHAIKTVRGTDAQGRTWYDWETGFRVVHIKNQAPRR